MEAADSMEPEGENELRSTYIAWAVAIVAMLAWCQFVIGSAAITKEVLEWLSKYDYSMSLMDLRFLEWGKFCQAQGLVLMLLPLMVAGILRGMASDPERRRGWLFGWSALLLVCILGWLMGSWTARVFSPGFEPGITVHSANDPG